MLYKKKKKWKKRDLIMTQRPIVENKTHFGTPKAKDRAFTYRSHKAKECMSGKVYQTPCHQKLLTLCNCKHKFIIKKKPTKVKLKIKRK